MELEVSRDVIAQALASARAAHPRECCGILLGEGQRITALAAARNVDPAPETHFEIDPQALIDAHRSARTGGAQIAGYYHSHPAGQASPSPRDQERSARDGSIWAIIADGAVTFWRDGEEGFEALPYRILER